MNSLYIPVIFTYLDSLPDDAPLKMSEYLYFSYVCNKPEEAASYLARTYLKNETLAIAHVTSEQKINEDTVFLDTEALIRELREIYIGASDNEKAKAYILDIFKAASQSGHECYYGVCCAFLFTFDLFFSDTIRKEYIEEIMSALHHEAIRILYPERHEHPRYLRAIYVCCEQYSSRTTNFFTRETLCQEFLKYCREYSERTDLQEYEILNNIYDLTMAYEKNGMACSQSNWREALKWFEAAEQTIMQPLYVEARPETAQRAMHGLTLHRSRCVISKAILNK